MLRWRMWKHWTCPHWKRFPTSPKTQQTSVGKPTRSSQCTHMPPPPHTPAARYAKAGPGAPSPALPPAAGPAYECGPPALARPGVADPHQNQACRSRAERGYSRYQSGVLEASSQQRGAQRRSGCQGGSNPAGGKAGRQAAGQVGELPLALTEAQSAAAHTPACTHRASSSTCKSAYRPGWHSFLALGPGSAVQQKHRATLTAHQALPAGPHTPAACVAPPAPARPPAQPEPSQRPPRCEHQSAAEETGG